MTLEDIETQGGGCLILNEKASNPAACKSQSIENSTEVERLKMVVSKGIEN